MTIETQASIVAWAVETFGPADSFRRVVVRACEEVIELQRAISVEAPPSDMAIELADIAIVMCRVATMRETDLYIRFAHVHLAPQQFNPDWYERFYALALAVEERLLTLKKIPCTCDLGHALDPGRIQIEAIGRELRMMSAMCGADIRTSIDTKMAINRAREWTLDGFGHGYHVRETG